MMTPSQERALLDATAAGLDDDLRAAYRQLLELIGKGMAPRDAVQAVIDTFEGEYAELLADGFSAILDRSIGTESVLALKVSDVTLSARLYAEAGDVAAVVQNIVDRHARGWQDARTLTLELYEGYGFRADEPIKWSPRNPRLPQYLRAELLTDPGLAGDLRRHFTKVHAQKLKTPALRAAYLEYLEALEAGKGAKALARKIDVAFHERMRYHAARIAQTELHRAYAERQAVELMDDPDVEFVQWRISATHPRVDICDYFAKVDRYGLGPGVYPKALAPIAPAHPHCLTGDALISAAGKISGVSKRWFDGDVVVITTASGKRISSTVNHPILTRRGWVGAGLLDIGDEVISRVDAVAVQGLSFAHNEHQNVPACISEIADAFFGSREVSAREVPVSAEDFHGDGEGSEVAVIGADRKLWDRVDIAGLEIGRDHRLNFAHAGAAGHLGNSVLDLRLEAPLGSSDGVVRIGGERGSLNSRELGHSDAVGLAHRSELLSGADQSPVNDVSADAELARQIQYGSTGPVFADKVIDIKRNAWRGHVYNLETEQGHYTANGIITHNCRCVLAPRLDIPSGARYLDNPEAGRAWLQQQGLTAGAQVMGSRARLQQALSGADPVALWNAMRDPQYHIKTVGQVERDGWPVR